MPFDPSAYTADFDPAAYSKPQSMDLSQWLAGKQHIPPGIAGLHSPEFQQINDQLSKAAVHAVAGSFMPAGTANPLAKPAQWVAEKTGLFKLPDYLMQKAANIKKIVPGTGQELIDQGLVGTQGMMQRQTKQALDRTGKGIASSVGEIPSTVSSGPVSQKISKLVEKYTAGDIIPEESRAAVNEIMSRAKDVASRPGTPPLNALKLKEIAGNRGYNAVGDKLAGVKKLLDRVEASGYGEELLKGAKEVSPQLAQEYAKNNATYSALKQAQAGLTRAPDNTLAALLGKSLPTNITNSVAAHILDQTGKAAVAAPNRLLQLKVNSDVNAEPTFDPSAYLK